MLSEIYLGEIYGCFEYSTSLGRAEITWGALASEAIKYLRSRPDESLTLKTTPRGKVLFRGDRPVAAESLEALLPLVDEAGARRAHQPRHPAEVVFPHLGTGESCHVPAREVRAAAESLLSLFDEEEESISVVYGYVNPLLLPHFPEPLWGGSLSGLRLPDDPHSYSLRAELGRLDLIRKDPVTGRVLEQIDARSWDVIRTSIGEIRLYHQPMDLCPFLREVTGLIKSLTHAADEIVTIRKHELKVE